MRYGFLMKVENDKLLILDNPNNYMIFNVDSKKWFEATKSKMNFMYTNQVWILIDLPER
jgi:hypothetical protein